MKVKISDLKELIREGYRELKEFRSVRNIRIIDRDGIKQIISQEDGQVLVKDASSLEYKDYLKLFKEFGIESVQVDNFKDWLKPGNYPRRVFLNKLAQFGGRQSLTPTNNLQIVPGTPTESFYINVYKEILKEETPPESSIAFKATIPQNLLSKIKHEAQRYMNYYSHMFARGSDYDFDTIVDRVARFVVQYLKLDIDIAAIKDVVMPLVKQFSSVSENKKKRRK